MEYMQLTLDEYTQAKEEIKKDLTGIVKSFVRVGWSLSRIDRSGMYKKDGYSSIAEFAKAEYGMTPSGVSRFIKVYEKYSVGGDTPELKEEYRLFNFSQLTEMLQISEEDRAMFFPEAKRESIRDFRAFTEENENNPDNLLNWNREPEDDEGRAIMELFRQKKDLMDEFFGSRAYMDDNQKEMAEILNPSGNLHFRFKTVFIMFYDFTKGLMINRFGQTPQAMSWKEFFDRVRELFAGISGEITWEKCFGEPQRQEAVTPAAENDQIPGQDSIENHPEYMPEPVTEEQSVPEEIGPERIVAPAQKSGSLSEEQKYSAEQNRIDRETKKKLQEMEDDEKMQHLPSDEGPKVHRIRLAATYYDDAASGRKSFELRKNDRGYGVGHILEMMEFKDGRNTGRVIRAEVTYMLEDYAGLEEGYCILGTRVMDFD